MKSRLLPILMIVLFLFCSGCETARGLKKDSINTWNNLWKIDDWVKEHLW